MSNAIARGGTGKRLAVDDQLAGVESSIPSIKRSDDMTGVLILVADASLTNLALAMLALERAGYEVCVATDAETASALICEHRPRVIMLDLELPGIDALDLARSVKTDPVTRSAIVIAVGVLAAEDGEQRARAAECDGYMTRPIDIHALPEIVAGYLRGSGPRV
jgi:CheY-like chemotaxis protein